MWLKQVKFSSLPAFCCCFKTPGPRHLIEESLFGCVGPDSPAGRHGSKQQTQQQEAESSRPQLWAWGGDRKLEMVEAFPLSRPAPRDVLPPVKLHLLSFSKQHHPLGIKYLSTQFYGDISYSNSHTGYMKPYFKTKQNNNNNKTPNLPFCCCCC